MITAGARKRKFVNLPMLMRIIGLLLLIEAALMIFPLAAEFIYRDGSLWGFIISMGITLGMGIFLVRLKPQSHEMGRREAILLTSLTWIILSAFGMIPFLISRSPMSVTDAFFEAINDFTTTGGSYFPPIEETGHSLLLWRSVMRWLGGMGIILFTLAVAPMLNNSGGIFLFNAEITGITHDKLRPRISSTARGLWIVYTLFTFALIGLLALSDMDIFSAICESMSVISTSGFTTLNVQGDMFNGYYLKIVLIIFMFLGGVNFSLIYKAFTGHFRNVRVNTVLRWYVIFIFAAYILLTVNVVINGLAKHVDDVTIDPLFQVVGTISSTGISEPDFAQWGALSTIVLVILMFTGACSGSTSGGAKIDRIIVLLKFLKNEFFKMMHPNNVTAVTINGRSVKLSLVQKILAFLCLYMIVIFISGTLLVILGVSLRESFFYTLSAISNTGIGTDTIGIGQGFASLPDTAKWILSIVMLTGRLELYTVLLVLTPYFWQK